MTIPATPNSQAIAVANTISSLCSQLVAWQSQAEAAVAEWVAINAAATLGDMQTDGDECGWHSIGDARFNTDFRARHQHGDVPNPEHRGERLLLWRGREPCGRSRVNAERKRRGRECECAGRARGYDRRVN